MKNINDKKIKLVGLTLACTLSATSVGSYIYDKTCVDHLKEECPFNKILGSTHQVEYINKNYSDLGIIAKEVSVIKTEKYTYMIDPILSYKKDGTVVVNIPKGYDYYDRKLDKCIKEVKTKNPELDKKGNEIYEDYIIIGGVNYADADYKYDYEFDENCLTIIKVS